jgi:enoyl-[acyl-carrier-protein] reductase (NADH)
VKTIEVPEDDIKQIYANAEKYTPLKRVASIDDVGKAIIFLCSEAYFCYTIIDLLNVK